MDLPTPPLLLVTVMTRKGGAFRSTVSEGSSITIVTLFNEVKDFDAALQLVKNEVDALQNLPDDLEKIIIKPLEPKLPVISVAIYGEGDEADLKRAARAMLRSRPAHQIGG